MVVIDPTPGESGEPLELRAAVDADYILVPDTCGLTTFTTELFHSADLAMRTYPGGPASYRVLEDRAGMGVGVGAAILPSSKVTHADHRPLVHNGDPVEIAYEAMWDRDNPLAADIEDFVENLSSD